MFKQLNCNEGKQPTLESDGTAVNQIPLCSSSDSLSIDIKMRPNRAVLDAKLNFQQKLPHGLQPEPKKTKICQMQNHLR